MKTIDMLIDEIKASETLQKLLSDAAKNNAIADFLKAQGCEATAEEFIAVIKAQAEELDADTLNAVAGGANKDEALLSVLSFGLGCLIEYLGSESRSGSGNGSDGRILCNDL